jgi:hypothetical protein
VDACDGDVRWRSVRPTRAEVAKEGGRKRGRLLIEKWIFIGEMDVCGFAI